MDSYHFLNLYYIFQKKSVEHHSYMIVMYRFDIGAGVGRIVVL